MLGSWAQFLEVRGFSDPGVAVGRLPGTSQSSLLMTWRQSGAFWVLGPGQGSGFHSCSDTARWPMFVSHGAVVDKHVIGVQGRANGEGLAFGGGCLLPLSNLGRCL